MKSFLSRFHPVTNCNHIGPTYIIPSCLDWMWCLCPYLDFKLAVYLLHINLKPWGIVRWWLFRCELLQAEWWQISQENINPLCPLLIWTVNAPLVLNLYSHSLHWKKMHLSFFIIWTSYKNLYTRIPCMVINSFMLRLCIFIWLWDIELWS